MTDSLLDLSLENNEAETPVENGFAALGLDEAIISNLTRNDITTPTPIQLKGIPLLLAGKDIIACAPTGTGKTAAFMLPSLQRLLTASEVKGSRGARIVVLTPTRELAQQVSKAAMMMAGKLPRMKTLCITGGEPFREQLRNINMPHEILVATPGRLLDHISRGRLDLQRVEMFVLDEADRMLDMGFSEDVQEIASQLPANHQTICFSATFDENVRAFAAKLLNEPEWIEVAPEKPRHETIVQQIHYADGMEHKRAMLHHWLGQDELGQAVVFTATKRDAEELAMSLRDAGMSADPLHGDMVQRQRTRMIQRLRRGETRILVATDVAARGIDVPGITHVFNFDLPKFAEDYVHRIGRTGRAGRNGAAISFVSKADVQSLGRIEKLLDMKLNITEIEGLEARFKPQDRRGGGGRGFGGNSRGGFGGGRRDNGGRSFGGGGRRDEGGRSFGGGGRRDDGGRSFGGGGSRDDNGYAGRRDANQNREGGYRGERNEGGRNNYDRAARPQSERFDSRTDNRYGDNRTARRHSDDASNRFQDDSRPRFNREQRSSNHHGQEERGNFRRDRDGNNNGAGRLSLRGSNRNEGRHERTERHH